MTVIGTQSSAFVNIMKTLFRSGVEFVSGITCIVTLIATKEEAVCAPRKCRHDQASLDAIHLPPRATTGGQTFEASATRTNLQ